MKKIWGDSKSDPNRPDIDDLIFGDEQPRSEK